ncbi:MAG TPA: ester cyclase [Acidobacteriota bacterium]
MTREEILQFFTQREEAWRRRDWDALATGHTHDGVVESPAFGTTIGRAAILENYEALFAAFPDQELQVQETLVDGDRAAVFWTAMGTHSGPFFGLAATGKRYQIHGVFLDTLKDGLIARERRMYDFTALLLQIGVLRAKPR